MSIQAHRRSLDEVAAHLDFEISDVGCANEAYARWAAAGKPRDLEQVTLWTFCYVQRYFLAKFYKERRYQPSDLDALVEQAYRSVTERIGQIDHPDRFASYVSVVCLNTFRNYVRRNRQYVSLDETSPLLADPSASGEALDRVVIWSALEAAIERLAPSLREIAHLRFVEHRSYDYIAAATERPVASVRAYVGKAVARFRKDRELRAIVNEMHTSDSV
jgi:RNA polymerase sigma factor (sigma-70 family)